MGAVVYLISSDAETLESLEPRARGARAESPELETKWRQ
jgi:hypothetical protein